MATTSWTWLKCCHAGQEGGEECCGDGQAGHGGDQQEDELSTQLIVLCVIVVVGQI